MGIEGQCLKNDTVVRFLCDDDIIHLAKQYYHESKFISEYFDRRTRRRPLWKSEAEYKAFFLDLVGKGDVIDLLEEAMSLTTKYLSKNTMNWVIDEKLLCSLEEELKNLNTKNIDENTKKSQQNDKQKILKVVTCLNKYARSIGYTGDFVLLMSSQFNSGFSKPDFSQTKIVFTVTPTIKVAKFGDKISSLAGISSERANFFYLYYKRDTDEEATPNIYDLCKELLREFI